MKRQDDGSLPWGVVVETEAYFQAELACHGFPAAPNVWPAGPLVRLSDLWHPRLQGAGAYPYPKMLFFHEKCHQGTGQFHTHLIAEKLPARLNTQVEMEVLFRKRLPHKVKALSKWKSIDIQRINQQDDDYKRISSYLGKQTNLELIALDPFNSDLSVRKQ